MSLPVRIVAGACVFAALAVIDLCRRGRAATRWREYAFLLWAMLLAMAYGALNDQVTSRISWEYFYYGKELDKVLGPRIPPDAAALHWEAMKVGIKATWSVGLLMGAALLIANNPSPGGRQLSFSRLTAALGIVLGVTVLTAAIGGWLGSQGWLDWISADFSQMRRTGVFRPDRFLCTFGIHLGGYFGAAAGTGLAVLAVRRWRRYRY